MSPAAEMGQGSLTSLPLILASEMDADWAKVKIIAAPPDDKLYGNPAFRLLMYTAGSAAVRGYFDKLLAHVKADASLRSDPLVLDRIGGLGAEIEASRLLAVRTAQVVEQGEVPLWQAAMLKVYASELMERLSETAFDLLGPGATLTEGAQGALCDSVFEYGVRDALLYTIGGGTNEIQRTLIALRGLDLPR